METNLSETDIKTEIIPNVSAKCTVHDCYAPIPSGDLYVEKFGDYGTNITEPKDFTTPNLVNNCRDHHWNLRGDHNRFALFLNGKPIGNISVSSSCSSGMVNLD